MDFLELNLANKEYEVPKEDFDWDVNDLSDGHIEQETIIEDKPQHVQHDETTPKKEKVIGQDKSKSDENNPKIIGRDVYDSAAKLNFQLAMIGPAVLNFLSKTSGNLATSVSGIVLGAFGLFGNRYFRNRGDDSAHSFMGQWLGGVHLTLGLTQLVMDAFAINAKTGDANPLLASLKFGSQVLGYTQVTFGLVNSYLYSDGIPKTAPESNSKKFQ